MHAVAGEETYQAPAGLDVDVKVDPQSKRLQILDPFAKWDGKDIEVLPCPEGVRYLYSPASCHATAVA